MARAHNRRRPLQGDTAAFKGIVQGDETALHKNCYNITLASGFHNTVWPAAYLARRYGLPCATARVVAELAGLARAE